MIATRKASQEVIQWAAAEVPELVGGSADLAPSTLTLIDGGGSVEAGEYGGRNLHFGIREHAMGAIVNGLTLSGFRAFGAGFLIFSDYMKGVDPARRDHADPVDVRLHARLDRRGGGRADAPADRAARHAARDAEPRRRAARRLQRDRRSPGATRCARPTGRPRWRSRARASRCGTRPPCPTTRSSAAPTSCTTRRRRPGADPDGARGSEVHIANDAREAARSRRHPGTARLDAVPRPLRRAGPGVPRQRPAAGRPRPRRRRGGEPDRLAPLGRRPGRRRRDGGLRRLRPREGPLRALRVHRRGRRRARPGGPRAGRRG